MMNTLSLCQCWFGDTIGGSFFLASEQARAFSDQGHKAFYVCCGLHEEQKITVEEQDGVEIWRYPLPLSSASGIRKLKHHGSWSRRCVEEITGKNRIDYAYGHTPLQSQGFLMARRNYDIPFHYQVHSPFPDELLAQHQHSSWTGYLKSAKARRIEAKIIKQADVVIGCSLFTKSRLTELYGKSFLNKFQLVPGIVNVERFQPSTDRTRLRSELPQEWHSEKTIFFTLRRLEQRMGLEDLIRATATLKANSDQFHVLIGGSGSLRSELEDLACSLGVGDTITFLGRVSDDLLASCYAAADCFVLPTRALECFGLIVLEAFACNTPVIGSDAGAIQELVGQQRENWSFPSGDAEALADRMQQFLLGNLKADCRLREIALQYSYEKIIPQWCEGINNIRSERANV